MIALDTETELISKGNLAPRLVCVSYSNHGRTGLAHVNEDVEGLLNHLLQGGIVGHNIAFDMAVIVSEFPELAPLIWKAYQEDRITDTMYREQLTHLAGGVLRGYDHSTGFINIEYSLDMLAQRHLGEKLDKNTWRLRYGEFRDVPLEEWPQGAKDYPIKDAEVTYRVWELQERNSSYLQDQYRQCRAAWWLQLCSCWGITTDLKAVDGLEKMYSLEYEALKEQLLKSGLVRENGTRDTKAAALLMEQAFPDGPKTETGKPSIANQACIDSGNATLKAYGEFSGFSHKLKTELPPLKSGIVQTRYNVLMESGRTSSEKPNIQNPPRKPGVRECYVARPGHVFLCCDYSAFELHAWAQACIDILGYSTMAEVLNAGVDPHGEMAKSLGDVLGSSTWDDTRQVGKVGNFGFPGGLGAKGFREYALSGYGLHLDEGTCYRTRGAWRSTWREADPYLELMQHTSQSGSIMQLRSQRLRGNVSYCQAANTLFQGLAADAAKAAGFEISRRCYQEPGSALFASRIVVFLHDEFILETPEEVLHEASVELSRVMCEQADIWMPDVPNKAEATASRRWSKKTKRVVKEGRLCVWEANSK